MSGKRTVFVNKGDIFNHLTVINESFRINKKTGHKVRVLECKCVCQKVVVGDFNNITKGKPASCGCKRIFNTPNPIYATTHGMTKTRIYACWKGLITRCNSNLKNVYPYYKGKGITVCDEWKNDFMAFYKWSMENGYNDTLTLDRKENDKGYYPENCRWVTMKVQGNNKTVNIVFTSNGIKVTLGEICDFFNLNYMTIYDRVRRHSMNIQEAIKRGNQDFSKIKYK